VINKCNYSTNKPINRMMIRMLLLMMAFNVTRLFAWFLLPSYNFFVLEADMCWLCKSNNTLNMLLWLRSNMLNAQKQKKVSKRCATRISAQGLSEGRRSWIGLKLDRYLIIIYGASETALPFLRICRGHLDRWQWARICQTPQPCLLDVNVRGEKGSRGQLWQPTA
jgi:hypothetical protein